MARWSACVFSCNRYVHYDLLRIMRSMFRNSDDDPTRDEFLAVAGIFVRVHDNPRLHRRVDRIQDI